MSRVTIERPTIGHPNEGAWDVLSAFKSWRLWAFFGLNDIRQRYRRSAFGPLWLALGLGATILGIGLLYSQILKVAPGSFIPFLAISLLVWNLISSCIIESTTVFQASASLISSMRLPFTSFILRAITRNVIVFAHCIIPAVIAFLFYKYPVSWIAFASIPGLFLLIANLYWISLATAMVCVRFRDVGQIVIYVMQLAVFITPIIWQPSSLRVGSIFIRLNPFYHLIELVRDPVFHGRLPMESYIVCSGMLVIGGSATLFVFGRVRRYLIHWI